MSIREIRTTGFETLMLATSLLQRARQADPHAGLWEAADIQWSWRMPRRSDEVEKLFWLDEEGPVAGVLLTSSPDDVWQCDPIVVPHTSGPEPEFVWRQAMEHGAKHSANRFEVPVDDDDQTFRELARRSGLTAGEKDNTAWMDGADQPAVQTLAEGFLLVDRTQRRNVPHHLRRRNGKNVAYRLAQCLLYDPMLDLSVEAADGRIAGYALFWFDPVTKVGLVEPVRVEDEFQRRGLAKAMLTAGIDRLVRRGAQRVKVSFQSDVAGSLYQGVGFRPTSTATWYRPSSV